MGRISGVSLIWAAMVVAQLQGFRGCVEEERLGLLALAPMAGVNTSSDCCLWVGVNCNPTTGHVERLHLCRLRNSRLGSLLNISLFLPFQELLELYLSYCDIQGLLDQPDLMKLSNLEILTISGNNLSSSLSIQDISNMRSLKYLDVSTAGLKINSQDICKMSNIIELNLRYNSITGPLPICVANMTKLQFLNLEYNMLSGDIPPTIANLSELRYISLAGNYFEGSFSLSTLANSSKLQYLDLSSGDGNLHLETETPTWFPSFQLKLLGLRNVNLNRWHGSVIPSFLVYQYDLTSIDLSHNQLEGTFPSWLLQNNSRLRNLVLSSNSLTGNLILPHMVHLLENLVISSNGFDGKLPDGIELLLPRLASFSISGNRFEGSFPSSLGALPYLSLVDFSFNNFSGELPKNLFSEWNVLRGNMATNFPSMGTLLLNNNRFGGTIEDGTNEVGAKGMRFLSILDISNNMFSGRLPSSITHSTYLKVLKISNNYFEGDIPMELCQIKLLNLDLSHNEFSGPIPSCFSNLSLETLSLRNNNLLGAIPSGFIDNSNLIFLDLSYNDFSDRILPNWIYSLKSIQILLMAGMQLKGEISIQLCALENIMIMDLSHNNFDGSIPSCLFERPFWVTNNEDESDLHLQANSFYTVEYAPVQQILNSTLDFSTVISNIVESLERYKVEFTTKGLSLVYQNNLLKYMTGLDVSNNKLSGQIPTQIEHSQAIRSLNLSNNQLWGSIPSNISKMRLIESLDLSSNNLSGEIPSDIIKLSFLSTFNVSNNNLSGPIPSGGQFSNFDENNYRENEYLCGPLLHRDCRGSALSTPQDEQFEHGTSLIMMWFWWTFVGSYICVVLFWAMVLSMEPLWCRGLCSMVDALSLKLYSMFIKCFLVGCCNHLSK